MEAAIEIKGDIKAKGRNGYFKAKRANAWRFNRDNTVYIEIFSKRTDGAAPIIIEGSASDIQLFVSDLTNAVNAAIYGSDSKREAASA